MDKVSSKEMARIFRALATEPRLAILSALNGRRTVAQLATITGLSRSYVSAILTSLERSGYVEGVRNGIYVNYRVADPLVEKLIRTAKATADDSTTENATANS